jgi:hypothetical protein
MKANTINPKGLIVAHPNEEILLAEGKTNNALMKQPDSELKIFRAANLQVLKSKYYKSIAYMFPNQKWKARTRYLSKGYWNIKDAHHLTDSIWQFGTDLKIFIAPALYIFKH